jgi:hypothetical protein
MIWHHFPLSITRGRRRRCGIPSLRTPSRPREGLIRGGQDSAVLRACLAAVEHQAALAERRLESTEERLGDTERRLLNAESLIRMNGKRLVRIEQGTAPNHRGTFYDGSAEPGDEVQALREELRVQRQSNDALFHMMAKRLGNLENALIRPNQHYDVEGGPDEPLKDD